MRRNSEVAAAQSKLLDYLSSVAKMPLQTAGVLDRIPQGSRVAIVRLRSMGDCVLTTPAIALLKQARPDLEIAVVVEERFAGIFEGNPDVAAVLPPSAGRIARLRPWLCLNLHGGTRSQWLTLASRARIRAGFGHHRGAALYHVRIPTAQQIYGAEKPFHTAEQLASAVFYLGVPQAEIPPARLFAQPYVAEKAYAVIHPAAAMAYKTWPAEGFLEVAAHLEQRWRLAPVFIGARSDDLTPFSGYQVVQGASLGVLKSLLASAAIFIGNDSGPAHVACALGVAVVVLYGRTEHEIHWAPWRAKAARTLADARGIAAIPAARVIEAVDDLAGLVLPGA